MLLNSKPNQCLTNFRILKRNKEKIKDRNYLQPPILTEEFDPEKAEPSLTVEGDVVLKVFTNHINNYL